jgi:hypothetical protein
MTNLALFDGTASTEDALARLAGRSVSMVRPRLVGGGPGEAPRTLLPGDPGYY